MSSPLIKIRLTVLKMIAPEARQVACAKAHEAAVLSLCLSGQLTTTEAAREVGLSPDQCLDWLAGADLPLLSDALNERWRQKKRPQIEVTTRDHNYYNVLIDRGILPANAAPTED